MSLLAALRKLDKDNDDQWTADGLPIVAVVQELAADTSITRKMISQALPGYTRESLRMDAESGEPDASKDESGTSGADPVQSVPDVPVVRGNEQRVYNTVDDVRAHMAELDSEGVEQARILNAAQERIKAINIEMSRLSQAIPDSMADHEGNQSAIQRYLKTNAKVRADKAAQQAAILKSGIDLNSLNPKAPIDRALNNRNRNPANKRAAWPLKQVAV